MKFFARNSAQAYMNEPKMSAAGSACGTACGAGDKEPETKPSACGAGDK